MLVLKISRDVKALMKKEGSPLKICIIYHVSKTCIVDVLDKTQDIHQKHFEKY